MSYTLGQAAKATGKSKAAISEAIRTGKISANKQPNGSYRIEPVELHRVYPPVQVDSKASDETEHFLTGELNSKIMVLECKLQALSEMKDQLADERDDLRRRLDQETEERRRLTLMITHQPEAAPPEPPKPALWHHLLTAVLVSIVVFCAVWIFRF